MTPKAIIWLRLSVMWTLGFSFIFWLQWPSRADWDGPTSPELQAWFKTVQNARGRVVL